MIDFAKFQAMGNDFLVTIVDDVTKSDGVPELARTMCSRIYGAGADGLIVVDHKSDRTPPFSSRIFNADGSEAEVSGNGTRSVAAYLFFFGIWSEPEINIGTVAGTKTGTLVRRSGLQFEFAFDMGTPELRSDKIPVGINPPATSLIGYRLEVEGELLAVTCVSMGNPHCSLFATEWDDETVTRLGPMIENHPLFPNRTNVEFIRPAAEDHIEVKFWERGVGRTLSSGTGSCAAAVASALNEKARRRVRVSTAGGDLQVNWREDDHLILTASVEILYQGQWLKK
jgi:diaminopimelate epimerase